jgi:hypothetical protein
MTRSVQESSGRFEAAKPVRPPGRQNQDIKRKREISFIR